MPFRPLTVAAGSAGTIDGYGRDDAAHPNGRVPVVTIMVRSAIMGRGNGPVGSACQPIRQRPLKRPPRTPRKMPRTMLEPAPRDEPKTCLAT